MLTRYYQKKKENLSKKAHERCQNLSREEQNKMHQYIYEWYRKRKKASIWSWTT